MPKWFPKGLWEHYEIDRGVGESVSGPHKMEPTTFRTLQLNTVGTPNAAISVVGAAPYPRRVVALNRNAGDTVFVAFSPSELNIPTGGAFPSGASFLPANSPQVFALAPGQKLFAAGTAAIGNPFVSISASAAIPVEGRDDVLGRGVLPTMFKTFTLQPSGAAGAARQIVPAAGHPQRIVIVGEPLSINIRVTSSPVELNTPNVANPGGAFAFDSNAGVMVFVVAPDQPVYATLDPGSPVNRVSVSVSVIDPMTSRGNTGIPGAGSVE